MLLNRRCIATSCVSGLATLVAGHGFAAISEKQDVTSFGADPEGKLDSRSAIQSAIETAEDRGGGIVYFPSGIYRIVIPQRTSDTTNFHAYDGMGLVISQSSVTLEGADRTNTCLKFQSAGDLPMASNWQMVSGSLWRGPGIFIRGGSSRNVAPGGIIIRKLMLDGGAGYTGNDQFPANPHTGDGWDLTHKGIMVEPDRFVGDIETSDCEVTNFRGELLYQGGPHGGIWRVHSNKLHSTNGDCFSSSMRNDVRNNVVYNAAFDGIECGYFSGDSIYEGNTIRDCDGEGISLVLESETFSGSQSVSNNVVENCRTGIICKSPQNTIITDNSLVDCGGALGSGYRAMQFYDNGESGITNLTVIRNRISAGKMAREAAIALYFSDSLPPRNVRIEDNHINQSGNGAGAENKYRKPLLIPKPLGPGNSIRGNAVRGAAYSPPT